MRPEKQKNRNHSSQPEHNVNLEEIRKIQKRNKKYLQARETEERKEADGKITPFIIACVLVNIILLISLMITDQEAFLIMLMLVIWEIIIVSLNKDIFSFSGLYVSNKSMYFLLCITAVFTVSCLFIAINYKHFLLYFSIAILIFVIWKTKQWPTKTYQKIIALQQTRTLHVLMFLLTISGILELLVQKQLLPTFIGELVFIFASSFLFTYMLRETILIVMNSSVNMESTLQDTHTIELAVGLWINREHHRDKNFSCIPMVQNVREGKEACLYLSASSTNHGKPEKFYHILLTSFGIVLIDPFPNGQPLPAIVQSYDHRLAIMQEILRNCGKHNIPVYGCVVYKEEEEEAEAAKNIKEKIPVFSDRDLEHALIHLKKDAQRICELDHITLLQLYSDIEGYIFNN